MSSEEQKKIATIVFLDGREVKVQLNTDFFPDVVNSNDGEKDVCFLLDEIDGKQTGCYRQSKAKVLDIKLPGIEDLSKRELIRVIEFFYVVFKNNKQLTAMGLSTGMFVGRTALKALSHFVCNTDLPLFVRELIMNMARCLYLSEREIQKVEFKPFD